MKDLPKPIQNIIDSFDENAPLYSEPRRIQRELNHLGYTCEWDLSGEITDVYKITEEIELPF